MAVNSLLNEGRSWSGNERNCCFLNVGRDRLADISAISGLNHLDDSRAVAAVDWDHDGDLDLWMSNRNAPRVRFLKNNRADGNRWIAMKLEGHTSNRDAIGARVTLELKGEPAKKLVRTLYAGDAFVSQSSKWLHFGLGETGAVRSMQVRWPGGEVEVFGTLASNRRYRVVQGSGQPQLMKQADRSLDLKTSNISYPPSPGRARFPLAFPIPVPLLDYRDFDGHAATIGGAGDSAVLVNLWSSSCRPCLAELAGLTTAYADLQTAGLRVVALSVDRLDDDWQEAAESARVFVDGMSPPYSIGWASAELLDQLEAVQRALLDVQQPLPLPSSFLIDRHGRVSVIYKGPLAVDRLLEDVTAISLTGDDRRRWSSAFDHRWALSPKPSDPMLVAVKLYQGGFLPAAIKYAKRLDKFATNQLPGHEAISRPDVLYFIGSSYRSQGNLRAARQAWERVVEMAPNHHGANVDLSRVFYGQRAYAKSIQHGLAALKADPDDAQLRTELASTLFLSGDAVEAIRHWRLALRSRPDSLAAANSLAWVLATHPDSQVARPKEAVRLAQAACTASQFGVSQYLRTLAAALARADQFDAAVEIAERSLVIDRASGAKQAIAMTESALRRYRNEKPLLVPPPRPASSSAPAVEP